MALVAALLTQKQAAKDQRRRDRDAEREEVRGTLEAIATELEVFKKIFLDDFKKGFNKPNPQTSLADSIKFARIDQSLFSVFDSNAAILGRVTDAALRHKIVATYVRLKALINTVNHYTERQAFWESVRHQPSIGGGLLETQGEVEAWAGGVQQHILKLETEIPDLLSDIRKYLDS